ncbi:hypothetical protein JK192_13675 [Gluconobacter cerinus]|uniref:hypothetical protein n=1 Tax=Gluconobacter cerinus TaxID=38307 RepID=UPI001B8D256C|nr:hypothetical protein [Gluconobacter cerinus]MBS1032427.1 hypothetical protein [Gluconobacter cerinus]
MSQNVQTLVGIGLYTPTEAGRLINVRSAKLRRWLQGHEANGKHYSPLWKSEIDLDDGKAYLSFRDMLEARVASSFIENGLSAKKLRRAIEIAQQVVGERPLATKWLKTDGRSVFLQVAESEAEEDGEPECLDLFRSQYAFARVVKDSLRDIQFDGIYPTAWWPQGEKAGVLIDPARSFGKPIEKETSVPTEHLASAVRTEGSVELVAKMWDVPVRAVRRAVAFEQKLSEPALAA